MPKNNTPSHSSNSIAKYAIAQMAVALNNAVEQHIEHLLFVKYLFSDMKRNYETSPKLLKEKN